ncbi:hypothetical protein SAMN05444274_102494 [Mariniphaga anaerophila]|uniref:Uncharacterized protein n=1 Tax=Mariniphaga anaerophila TaxID=1484053 RepID=A0A1M4WMB0_9BACT|nr:hypothetical protein SAMN05444274_102494 [Mariniphaga anaerophila]
MNRSEQKSTSKGYKNKELQTESAQLFSTINHLLTSYSHVKSTNSQFALISLNTISFVIKHLAHLVKCFSGCSVTNQVG